MQAARLTAGSREADGDRAASSRDTISPTGTEDSMARGCSRNVGSARPSSKALINQLSGHLLVVRVHTSMRIVSGLTMVLVVGCIAAALCTQALAQTDSPDVHITPRIQHDQPKGP